MKGQMAYLHFFIRKHVSDKDLEKIVQSLVVNEVMTENLGDGETGEYFHFKEFPRNALNSTNLAGLCKWINQHKNGIMNGRKAC